MTKKSLHSSILSFQIVLSLFVAVILDNLELDEDIKKLKQVNPVKTLILLPHPYSLLHGHYML